MRAPRPRRLHVSPLGCEALEARLYLSVAPDTLVAEQLVAEQSAAEPQLQSVAISGLTSQDLKTIRNQYDLTGKGQTVAIIDTGIAYDHQALGGGFGTSYRVVGGWDFAENDANPYDDGSAGSHGTHVAGIVGGNYNSFQGLADEVDLVALRVFNDAGQGQMIWVEQALQWVHAHRNSFANPITTVNLSLGVNASGQSLASVSILNDELAQLEADGIFVSVAAGNSYTSSNPSQLAYPASSQYVVPVASVDADGSLSYYSQRNSTAIAAPGRSILSTVPDYLGDGDGKGDDYARYSGTSMAAPYVAAASVLLREAYHDCGVKNVTEDMLYNAMYSTADIVKDATTGLSYHRLNLTRAIDTIEAQHTKPDNGNNGSGGSTTKTTVSLAAVRAAKALLAGGVSRTSLEAPAAGVAGQQALPAVPSPATVPSTALPLGSTTYAGLNSLGSAPAMQAVTTAWTPLANGLPAANHGASTWTTSLTVMPALNETPAGHSDSWATASVQTRFDQDCVDPRQVDHLLAADARDASPQDALQADVAGLDAIAAAQAGPDATETHPVAPLDVLWREEIDFLAAEA